MLLVVLLALGLGLVLSGLAFESPPLAASGIVPVGVAALMWMRSRMGTLQTASGFGSQGEASDSGWTYRLRIRLAGSSGLTIAAPQADLDFGPPIGRVSIRAWPNSSLPIMDAEWLVLTGSASSRQVALDRGARLVAALRCAFSKLRIAADFGGRAPQGRFTDAGKKLLSGADGRPVLHDEHGLIVYPSEPRPRLGSVLPPTLKLSLDPDRLRRAISEAAGHDPAIEGQEAIAYHLFAASRFESSADARLISLVMALETLITPVDRSRPAVEHVDRLIDCTRSAAGVDKEERDSIVSALKGLRKESISAAGRRLVEVLGDRTYGGLSAKKLWTEAYDVRSKLVHGGVPRPSRERVDLCAAHLEVLVADLLSGPLRDSEV